MIARAFKTFGFMFGTAAGYTFVLSSLLATNFSLGEEGKGTDKQSVLLVLGAEGEAEFGRQFTTWADRWAAAAKQADAAFVKIGDQKTDKEDRIKLKEVLAAEKEVSRDTLWIVLIGHGTFDGRSAKFNLRGADISAAELAEWLRPISRPLIVVNCASCSGPFINALSAPQRVIITATKNGHEQNFARFGDYFSSALTAAESDLDRDGQISVLEAFLSAAHGVANFYDQESRLATEHSLLDDTGDALGIPADWFEGVRAVKRPQKAGEIDGRRANQIALIRSDTERGLTVETRARRDALELELEALRDRKGELASDAYYEQLEIILTQLATLYHEPVREAAPR